MNDTTPAVNPAATPADQAPSGDSEVAELRARVELAEERAEAALQALADVVETADRTDDSTPPRFAVWDVTYERFLPGVHDDRKAAEKAAREHKGTTKIRTV